MDIDELEFAVHNQSVVLDVSHTIFIHVCVHNQSVVLNVSHTIQGSN